LTANWNTTFPAGTLYHTRISSDAFTTVNAFGSTTDSFLTFTGLAEFTPYHVQVATAVSGPYTDLGVIATPPSGASIEGTLTYGGSQPGEIIVEAFTTPSFSGVRDSAQVLSNLASQPYYLPVSAGTYYLRAYVDVAGDGIFRTWADRGMRGPIAVSGSVAGQNFSLSVDTVSPKQPVGLSAYPTAGQISLTWALPTFNTNGSILQDLRGYIIQRSTGGGFKRPRRLARGPSFERDFDLPGSGPGAGHANSYRVIAVDYSQNQSAPSAPVSASGQATGGMITGKISTFT